KGRKERRGVQGRNRGGSGENDDDDRAIIEDARFAAASTRPQFSSFPRGSRGGGVVNDVDHDGREDNKLSSSYLNSTSFDLGLGESLTRAIESDERFRSALASEPEKFGCVPARDKFGRKTNPKRTKKEKEKERRKDGRVDGEDEGGDDGDDEDDDGDMQDVSMEARIAYLNALSRGDISASSPSSSSSDDDDSDDDDDSSSSSADSSIDEVYGKSGIFDPDRAPLPGDAVFDGDDCASLTDEPSRYLCVLNLNWDRVRAVDVFVMLHSFCPPGTLRNVTVYPSDFGSERMERERVEGPPAGIWKGKSKGDQDEEGQGDNNDDEKADDPSGDESSYDEDDTDDRVRPSDDVDSDHDDHDSDNEEDEEEGEDAFNLAEATSKLYAHFPPQSAISKNSRLRNEHDEEEGFDVEKLREYEASKLRYYYAVATFASSEAASQAYEGIDGMEMEDTAAEIDVRVLPENAYSETVSHRSPRDSCDSIPARYEPPEDAAATALRQSRVTCTWERGDAERERKLTRYYGMGKDAWEAMASGNDIGFYLATSDNSSGDDESISDEEGDGEAKEGGVREKDRTKREGDNVNGDKNRGITSSISEKKKKKKGSRMRSMLGLEGSDSEVEDDGSKEALERPEDRISSDSSDSTDSDDEIGMGGDKSYADKNIEEKVKSPSTKFESESSSDEGDDDNTNGNEVKDKSKRQVTFMPGKQDLEGRIRSKLIRSKHASDRDGVAVGRDDDNGLSPYKKYLEKRKEKRRQRREARRNARRKEDQGNEIVRGDNDSRDNNTNDGMYGVDPEFGVAPFSDEESVDGAFGGNRNSNDGFFVDETSNQGKNKKLKTKKPTKYDKITTAEGGAGCSGGDKIASTKEELELLIAGDDDEEHAKDYDMRGLTKLERQSGKKLKGKRKRQLETLAANVSGQGFHIDTSDSRFAALLDGSDDRFGIDRTNPAYKETSAMKELLHEQAKRRNKNNGGRDKEWGMKNGLRDEKAKDVRGRDDGWIECSSGALELSSLVKSIQRKLA
ncbi:hypothetical protein ACHAXA_006079, partial [Cyclostephanos tholiformis]